jgi:hypothetical protein
MPTFTAKIVAVLGKDNQPQPTGQNQPVWQSPDGQRKIWKVQIQVNGKTGTVSTYSQQLANVGVESEVETYERASRNGGVDTFIKKPQAEGYGNAPSASAGLGGQAFTTPANAPLSTPNVSSGYTPKDEAAIKAMWSLGQAVSLFSTYGTTADLAEVERIGTELFHMVDRVKVSLSPTAEITVEDINQVFGDTENFDNGSAPQPWMTSN